MEASSLHRASERKPHPRYGMRQLYCQTQYSMSKTYCSILIYFLNVVALAADEDAFGGIYNPHSLEVVIFYRSI